jgi:hypothetical protein
MNVILFLLIFSIPALWIGSGIWGYGDGYQRGKPPFLVALFVMFAAWPIGLVAWLVFRPDLKDSRPKPFHLQDFREQ